LLQEVFLHAKKKVRLVDLLAVGGSARRMASDTRRPRSPELAPPVRGFFLAQAHDQAQDGTGPNPVLAPPAFQN